MKLFQKLSIFAAFAFGGLAYGQTSLNQTTLSGAITSGVRQFQLASCTGVVASSTSGGGSFLYMDRELMAINQIINSTSCLVSVAPRGTAGTKAYAHLTGTMVLVGPGQAFISYDVSGSCTVGAGRFLYTPVVNVNNGNQFLCSTVTGKVIPGWSSDGSIPVGVNTVVASAAGLITPSGPLFHVSGALAITGFNIPLGFDPTGNTGFCIWPDGAATTTNANNIVIASTMVVGKMLCYTYDSHAAKGFAPSY